MRDLRFACVVALGAILGAALPAGHRADAGAITERVVVNRTTGLAIDGFDPVAYFTDAAAIRGDRDIEVVNGSAIWRFRNEANRAAFLSHPEIYAPRFGGYDPVDAARGVIIAGHAEVWQVYGERLYLFSREDNLRAFAANPGAILKQADGKWPALLETLSGY